MHQRTANGLVWPSEAARRFFAIESAGDLTRGIVQPTLASARLKLTFTDPVDAADASGGKAQPAELLQELDVLLQAYGEDCPLAELVGQPLPYQLAARVLPPGYCRAMIDVALQELMDVQLSSMPEFLEARCAEAGHLGDVRLRLLYFSSDRLRIEVTGEARSAPAGELENPMVPNQEVPLNAGCDPAGPGRYCGYSTGGWTVLCPRCLAVHEAQQELLSIY
jgi:hypothetical protein